MEVHIDGIRKGGRLLKARDIAEQLAISRSSAYLLMQRGQLPTVRFGGSVRVRQEDLDEFILRNLSGRDSDL